MTPDLGLLQWADAKADELLLMGPLCRRVRADSRWIWRLRFEAALSPNPFTLIFHALEGDDHLLITFARLPLARARETVALRGASAAATRGHLERLEPWRMETTVGGGTDGYGVRADFRSAPMNVEASLELVNLNTRRPADARAMRALVTAFQVARDHLEHGDALSLLTMALTDHLAAEL